MEKTDFVEVKEDFRQFSSFVSDYSVDTNNVEILQGSVKNKCIDIPNM